jgi:hypothetical protein
VAIALLPLTLGPAAKGGAFTGLIVASGGTGPYTYAVTAGALPAGISLNGATGDVVGAPTAAGTSTFTITATDSLAATGVRDYTMVVNTLAISPVALGQIEPGKPFSLTLTGSGGTAPYTFAIVAGALPAGLTLVGSTISGTSTLGDYAFTVRVTDATGATADQAYGLKVMPPVYWYICARSEKLPTVPARLADQMEHNRRVGSAIGALSKSRSEVGDMKVRPLAQAIPDHLLCDGSAVGRVDYPQLFALLGTTWGAGDGTTTFNIPNLVGNALPVAQDAPTQTVTPSTTSTGETVTQPSTPAQTGGTEGGQVVTGGVPPKQPLRQEVPSEEV